jgi:hypothetical protein
MLAGSLLTSCSPSLLRRQTQGILIVTPLSGAAGRKYSSESLTNITWSTSLVKGEHFERRWLACALLREVNTTL